MEIKNVAKEVKNEYPTINEMSSKRLKKSIPQGWAKVGLTSTVIAVLPKNNVFASKLLDISQIAGGFPAPIEDPIVVESESNISNIIQIVSSGTQVISVVALLIAVIGLIVSKVKMGKFFAKKWPIITLIVSIIVFTLSFVINKIC